MKQTSNLGSNQQWSVQFANLQHFTRIWFKALRGKNVKRTWKRVLIITDLWRSARLLLPGKVRGNGKQYKIAQIIVKRGSLCFTSFFRAFCFLLCRFRHVCIPFARGCSVVHTSETFQPHPLAHAPIIVRSIRSKFKNGFQWSVPGRDSCTASSWTPSPIWRRGKRLY